MSLRIAFDLDGVLADMDGALARQAEIIWGEAKPPSASEPPDSSEQSEFAAEGSNGDSAPPPVRVPMTARQQRRLWQHVGTIEDFWEQLTEIEPGTIARLGAVALERRWEIIFLTKRPESAGATSQIQTQRWLESKGFKYPSVYVVQRSRGLIAAALDLDVVVDDRLENCTDVLVDSKARSILVWREDEKSVPPAVRRLGVKVVKTIEECLDVLVQVDSASTKKPRAMERVKQLLGLKEKAKG
jgi:hypothetical protein